MAMGKGAFGKFKPKEAPTTKIIATRSVAKQPAQEAKPVTKKHVVEVRSLSDLANYTPTGEVREKRYSAIIVRKTDDGYELKNNYTFTEFRDGKRIVTEKHIPRTYCPVSAIGNAEIGMTVSYTLQDRKPVKFKLEDDLSAGLAVLRIKEQAPEVTLMNEAELFGWANGVWKDETFQMMNNVDRIDYVVGALERQFGEKIYRTTSFQGNTLYIVNVDFATAANTSVPSATNNARTNAATTVTTLTTTTATNTDNTDSTADLTATATATTNGTAVAA